MEQLIEFIGGMIVWLAKGCQTPLHKEIDHEHRNRNALAVIVICLAVFSIFIIINNNLL
jgi:hypothetical protein